MNLSKIIFIASDHAGLHLKNALVAHLKIFDYTPCDLGTHKETSCDYPEYAHALCKQVLETGEKGILICGTGIGMSIAANRHAGIRAALCTHEFHSRTARLHNNANVLCLGERITSVHLACLLTDIFLTTSFEKGRHESRVASIEL